MIDLCFEWTDWRFDNGDFNFYGFEDECLENQVAYNCLPDLDGWVNADLCHYQSMFNVCTEEQSCLVIVEVDGQ